MKILKTVLALSILAAVLFIVNIVAKPTLAINAETPALTPTLKPTPTPTPFSLMNVHTQNNTGQTANGLEIFIEGNVEVLKWWSGDCPFSDISWAYYSGENITIIRFYNGTVPYLQKVDTCLWLKTHKIVEKYTRKWIYNEFPSLTKAGAAMSQEFQKDGNGLVELTLTNTPLDGGPMTIGIVQVGPGKRVYSLPELLWRNPTLDQEIPWAVTQMDIHLKTGEAITIPVPDIDKESVNNTVSMVYRAKIWLDAEPNNVVEYVGEFIPAKDYVISYIIQNDWGTGAAINVTITNNTPVAINGWTLEWQIPDNQIITNMWNASYTQSGDWISVKSSEWNAYIAPNGGKVSFGFSITYSGTTISKPRLFMLNGIPCQTQ